MLYVCPHCGAYTEFRGIRVHPDELTCDCGGTLEPAECEVEITAEGLAELEAREEEHLLFGDEACA
jgi:hypothetical protein